MGLKASSGGVRYRAPYGTKNYKGNYLPKTIIKKDVLVAVVEKLKEMPSSQNPGRCPSSQVKLRYLLILHQLLAGTIHIYAVTVWPFLTGADKFL